MLFDIIVFVLFILITLGGLASIFFHSTNVLAYIQFLITAVGLLGSLKEMRPSILGKVIINVKTLRVINLVLVVVVITLQAIILIKPTWQPRIDPPTPTLTSSPIAAPVSPKIIKIASEFPTSGLDTTTGLPLENGVRMAIDDANQNNWWPGYKLELMPLNDVGKGDRGDPDVGVQNLNKAITDNLVAGIVGPYYSRVAKALLPIANQAPIALISPSTTYACLTKSINVDPNCSESNDIGAQMRPTKQLTFFRLATTDDLEGKATANYFFNVRHYKKIVLVKDDSDPYIAQLAWEFQQAWEEQLHGQLTPLGIPENRSRSNVDTYQNALQSVISVQPDLIYFIGSSVNGTHVLQALSKIPEFKTVPFAGDSNIISTNFLERAGEFHPSAPVYAILPIQDPAHSGVPEGRNFEDVYAAHGYHNYRPFVASAYAATKILIEAIKIALQQKDVSTPHGEQDVAGAKTFRQAILKALQPSSFLYTGVTGKHGFDANGDTTNHTVSFYRLNLSDPQATWTWLQQVDA